MIPTPGIGHLTPIIEFAKKLSLNVTFLIPTNAPPSQAQTTLLTSLPPLISHVFLPPVTLSDLPPTTNIGPLISLTLRRSLPSLRRSLLSLAATHRVTVLIVDLLGTDAFDLAAELNIPPFVFFPSSAMALYLAISLPRLDQEISGHLRDLPEPLIVPGCVPVFTIDIGEIFDKNQDSEAYKCLLYHASRYALAEGIIHNSFSELEPDTIKSLLMDKPGRPPVYSIEPLVNQLSLENSSKSESEQMPRLKETSFKSQKQTHECACLKWLDEQPRGSVIFVCFGSGGTLSRAQIKELALGLEMSQHRFLWVVKRPNEEIAHASYFDNGDHDNHKMNFLPEGFVNRTKGMGLVVASWAPQAQVLGHESIGGFVTHCGWNSILESVVNGVPLVLWPLYADQKVNAVVVTESVKVALRAIVGENGLVEREEIASIVKRLMEGEEGKKLHHRMKVLV